MKTLLIKLAHKLITLVFRVFKEELENEIYELIAHKLLADERRSKSHAS